MTVKGYIIQNTGKIMNQISKLRGHTATCCEYEHVVVNCTWFDGPKSKNANFHEDILDFYS